MNKKLKYLKSINELYNDTYKNAYMKRFKKGQLSKAEERSMLSCLAIESYNPAMGILSRERTSITPANFRSKPLSVLDKRRRRFVKYQTILSWSFHHQPPARRPIKHITDITQLHPHCISPKSLSPLIMGSNILFEELCPQETESSKFRC